MFAAWDRYYFDRDDVDDVVKVVKTIKKNSTTKVTVTNAHAKKFRYASANPKIATVSSKGVITSLLL